MRNFQQIFTPEIVKRIMPIFAFFIADRASKSAVMSFLDGLPQKFYEVAPFLNFIEVRNYGVSFGLLKADNTFELAGLLLLTSGIFCFLVYRMFVAERPLEGYAYAAVIGGAAGNIYDRFFFGAVYDFIDMHLYGIHFWTFNIADTAVTLGAIGLLWDGVFGANASENQKNRV